MSAAAAFAAAFAGTHMNLGTLRHALGRIDEALEAYDRTIALDPKHQDAWYNRALACYVKGTRRARERT